MPYASNYVSKGTFVPGEGDSNASIMLIGEGPGVEEDKHGRPFVGKAGRELWRYLWNSCQLTRNQVWTTNLVKYRVPEDGDPSEEDIARDKAILDGEIRDVNPDVIVTIGRWSTRRFLGDDPMEIVHGVPRFAGHRVIFPCLHPAFGLHSTEAQGAIAWDFEQLGKLLRGEPLQWAAEDEHPKPHYGPLALTSRRNLSVPCLSGVDTEGSVAKPWCLTFTQLAGQAALVRMPGRIGSFEHAVLHNALHDLGVLRALQVSLDKFDDTMLMAYLLCVEPQGLKALAKRHCGMEMQSYEELVHDANLRHAADYLDKMVQWLNKRSNSASSGSGPTCSRPPSGPRTSRSTSGRGGRKSAKTSRKAGRKR